MRPLKNKLSSATAINDHDFRNLNEVKKFMDTLKQQKNSADKTLNLSVASDDEDEEGETPTVRVRKFGLTDDRPIDPILRTQQRDSTLKNVGTRPAIKPAELKGMAKHFEVLHTYMQQLELLDSLKIRVRGAFHGSKKLDSVLADIEDQRKEVATALGRAQEFLDSLAKKKLPPSVEKTFKEVTVPIVRMLTGRYRKKQQLLQVNSFDDDGKGVIQFTFYTKLSNLKNDKGFVYKDFFIIVQCAIDHRGVHYYFTDTSFRFDPPSTESLISHSRGHSFNRSKDGKRLLQTHMKMDEHLDILTTDSIPVMDGDVSLLGKDVKDFIKSIKVDEDSAMIRFQLVPGLTDQKVQNIQKDILADLSQLLHSPRSLEKMKTKVVKTIDKSKKRAHAINIWFTGAIPRIGQEYRDNASALHNLKTELGLTDEEVRKVSRILRSRQTDGDK